MRDLHINNDSAFAQPIRPRVRIGSGKLAELPQVEIKVYGY